MKDGAEQPVALCQCGTIHERAVPPSAGNGSVIPAPYPPGQYGPVRVLFEERFGGFIGFEWDGGLYAAATHLPPDVRAHLPEQSEAIATRKGSDRCKKGHKREPGKRCGMCERLASRASRERRAT